AKYSVISILRTLTGGLKGFDAARQLSGDGGRKGPGENPVRFSRADAEGRLEVLCNKREGRSRQGLSHEGVGRDRKEAGEIILSQQRQAEISGAHKLLRASGGGGWSGAANVPGNLESRQVPRPIEP